MCQIIHEIERIT